MPPTDRFPVIITAPNDHPTPFPELVDQVSSMGVKVDRTEPVLRSIRGEASQDVLDRVKAIPGLAVSREQRMGLA